VTPLSVGLFCGARDGTSPAIAALARQTGALLASRGHSLVYGGGGTGVMGTVAHAAFNGGAKITGVIPRFLYERERGDDPPEQDFVVTDDLFMRKREIFLRSDAILALPGGFGTLDEVLEAISLNYLGVITGPIVLLDADDYWASLTLALAEVVLRGYASSTDMPMYQVAHDPVSAMNLLELG
jgi:uncharacterized protein (TIGR00730 family)